jgi:hypothetical protein
MSPSQGYKAEVCYLQKNHLAIPTLVSPSRGKGAAVDRKGADVDRKGLKDGKSIDRKGLTDGEREHEAEECKDMAASRFDIEDR